MSGKALPKRRTIFLSCSTNDINIARDFRSALDQLPRFWGFIARDEPRTFIYPSEKIAQTLEICSAYIILYTQSGLKSPMVNQEFGFFYHRYRAQPGKKPPILLVKSHDITGQINGFAYAREAIPLDPLNPNAAISDVLWELKNTYSINFLEIKCRDHYSRLQWPSIDLCRDCVRENSSIEFECYVCGEKIQVSPYTFLRF